MSAKEDILAKCRASIRERFDMPSLDDIAPITWEDPLARFKTALESAGGKSVEVPEGSDIDALIRELCPNAHSFARDLQELPAEGLDVGIVEGTIGVAENACVWVPQTMKEKAVCFICEHLVIILPRKAIVNNMHEAYRAIEMNDYGYGCFISGPSKTADIAQVLVMGAQAARSVTVLLTA